MWKDRITEKPETRPYTTSDLRPLRADFSRFVQPWRRTSVRRRPTSLRHQPRTPPVVTSPHRTSPWGKHKSALHYLLCGCDWARPSKMTKPHGRGTIGNDSRRELHERRDTWARRYVATRRRHPRRLLEGIDRHFAVYARAVAPMISEFARHYKERGPKRRRIVSLSTDAAQCLARSIS